MSPQPNEIPVAPRVGEPPKKSPSPAALLRAIPWWVFVLGLVAFLIPLVIARLTPLPAAAPGSGAPATPATMVEPTLPPGNDPQRVDQLFGHFRYDQAPVGDLRTVARAADGYEFKLRASAAQSYLDMSAAAQQEGIELTVISAFRSTEEQEKLFFDISRQRNQSLQQRAQTSAPPGYSEHHTGNAIDLGDAAVPSANLSPNFEQTRAFRWLEQNAKRYSFELSFPRNNCQGVMYEPWHWRFVGDPESLKMFYQNRPQPSICPPSP